MFNKDVYLYPRLMKSDSESSAIREGFGIGLREAGEKDQRVVALCADLTDSTKVNLFRDKFPGRFVEMGVAEQSMASVASGMAAMGKIPFLTSYAMFSPGRNWEQIRTTICYNNVNVKIIGSHAGVSVGPDGGTHQAIEDIAITRVIPNMTVIVPCDCEEARKATLAAAKHEGPVYIRLQREPTAVITTDVTPFEIGKVKVFYRSKKPRVTIFACGAIINSALIAAKNLEKKGIGTIIVNVSTIKPLDSKIVDLAQETGKVVVVEEHQRIGGLGSAIAERLSEESPMPVYRIGIDDKFGQSGTPEELLSHYGLTPERIQSIVELC